MVKIQARREINRKANL